MRIQIYSDLHSDINIINDPSVVIDTKKKADIYIDAGDTGEFISTREFYKNKFWNNKKVLFVGGNHTHYNYGNILSNQEELKNLFPAQSPVTYLQDSEIIIGDCVFIGCTLWTDYCVYGTPNFSKKTARNYMNDFKFINFDNNIHLTPEHCQTMHKISLKNLHKRIKKFGKDKKVIVITHHSPSIRSCLDVYKNNDVSASFCSNLEEFIKSHNIFLWIHGHMHNVSSYKIGGTYVICNPLGYTKYNENSGFFDDLVIDV